jgi:hypothetical protein
LQDSLQREQKKTARYEQEIIWLKQTIAQKEQATVNEDGKYAVITSPSKGRSIAAVCAIALLMMAIGAFAGRAWLSKPAIDTLAVEPKPATTGISKSLSQKKLKTHKKRLTKNATVTQVKADTVAASKETTPKTSIQPPADNSKGKDAGKTFTLFNNYAYFHDRPDAASVRKANINRWNNARLTAIDDIYGYIYVIYKNDQGQVSKGWLDKKDLIKVN